jgi:phosphoglycolate phosphatase-like HAD superfamily hydrolase
MMHKLVLWDVDSTLLLTGGVASQAMRAAMARVFGPITPRERRFFSGKTDWQIVYDMFPDLEAAFIDERMSTFEAAYVEELRQRYANLARQSYPLPGVLPLLRHLHGKVVQAPLTGNMAPIARTKLELLGLLTYLNVEVGAYGSDHHDRVQLVPIAAERAAQHTGSSFEGRKIVVVGDTPNDIRCAKLNGARIVAVATGPYSTDELRAHEPDVVLPDLSDFDAACAAILGE